MPTRILRKWIFLNLIMLAACSGLTPGLIPVEGHAPPMEQSSTATITPPSTPTQTPFPAFTNTPTQRYVTRTPTPTPLPLAMFTSQLLIPQAKPTAYLSNCSYLQNRWDDAKSPPGTVAVAVMYHQAVPGPGYIRSNNQVTAAQLRSGLQYARRLGFELITSQQMADFLEKNALIPERSVLLIIDDLESAAIKAQYESVLDEFGFNATLAYIAGQKNAYEWDQVEALIATGRFDLQAHGYLHNDFTYIYPTTPEDTLVEEIFKPVSVVKEHSGKKPAAFIWPGGDYTPHAVDLAAQAGYHLGFTVRNRGPLLFNWVPQGTDEQATDHPLLVLPRAWSKDIWASLDQAVAVSAEAKAFADANREAEIGWYMRYCKNQLQ